MAVLTSKLIVSLVDQVTAPLRAINASLKSVQDGIRANNAAMDAMRGRVFDAAGAAVALGKAISSPVQAAIEFESRMADIRKVSGFDDDGLAAYGRELRTLATTEIPMAVSELAELSAEAAASGVADTDLLNFTRLAAKAGVAWEISGGAAGEALAKIRTQLGLTNRETELYADAINHVSDNTASKAPELLDFTKRVAAQGEFFGISKEASLAWGAAMISSGADADVAATSFRNMGRALTAGVSATERQRNAFDLIRIDPIKLAKDMQEDSGKAINTVLQRISKLRPDLINPVMRDIFGDEARALTPLLKRLDILEKSLALTSDQTAYAGSVGLEFETRAATTAYQVQRMKNQISDLGISIGNALLPPLNDLISIFSPLVKSLSELTARNPGVTRAIIGLTAGLVAFRVAATAAAWGGLFLKGGILQAALASLTLTRSLMALPKMLVFGPLIAGFGSLRAAIRGTAAAQTALQAKSALGKAQDAYKSALAMRELARSGQVAGLSMKQATADVRSTGMALAAAQQNMKAASTAMVGTGSAAQVVAGAMKALKIALIGTGVGAILVGIGAAAAFVYQNWTGITQAVGAFGPAFLAAIGPAKPLIEPLIESVSSLGQWIWELLGPIDETGQSWVAWGAAAGAAIGNVVRFVMELPGRISALAGQMIDAGRTLMASMRDGAVEAFDEFMVWVRGIPARIIAAIGRIDLSSIIQWPSMPSWLGGGAPQRSGDGAPAVDGARASGGPVWGGGRFLVGEQGPELFSPSRSGFIIPAAATRALALASSLGAAAAPAHAINFDAYTLPEDVERAMMQSGSTSAGSGAFRGTSASMPVLNQTNHIQITISGANGINPDAIARELGRRVTERLEGALMDIDTGV